MTVLRRACAALVACALLAVPAQVARADDPPAQFTLTGAGYGHGVGMSQWGAYGMAKAGYDATGIVTHYYTGTTVSPVQDDMDIRVNLLYKVGSAKLRTEQTYPSGAYLGDGSELSPEEDAELCKIVDRFTYAWPWRDGDIMILDNLTTGHGRNPFSGTRATEVSLLD
mgnify:CR=1 FL=1